jgi:8-amino-7-oxononanoate synthase
VCPRKADIRDAIKANIELITQNGLKRVRRAHDTPQGPVIRLNNKNLTNFCSNDYLGLANHPALIKAMKQGVDQYGVGSGASQLICGYTAAHEKLEEKVSDFTGRQRTILFSSGYLANLAIVNTLLDRADMVLGDRLNHASMIDAARISRAVFKRYRHVDVVSLANLLKVDGNGKKLVMTDGVFSMDGDIAPLPDLSRVCAKMNAWLVVDDAHGFGVLGENGGGTVQQFGLTTNDVSLLMATFGKALGTAGAFIAGDEEVIEQFIQSARTLIYSTALPPALAFATVRALELVYEEKWRGEHLNALINRFKNGAKELELPVINSDTAIQPLLIGTAEKAVKASRQLFEKGLNVVAIRPPTVPNGTSRLRITLTAAHSEEQVDQLLDALCTLA